MDKILVIEDSSDFQKVISRTLFNYSVTVVPSAEDAAKEVYREKFDLILLDINLPGKSGYSFLSELQADEKTREIPVICITGKKDISDKTTAFSLGADDYLVKPFDPIELKARVDAKIAKTNRLRKNDALILGEIKIDLTLHRVFVTETREEIELTQTEFKILSYLCRRIGQVYTRDQLLIAVWGENAKVLDRAVDVHVCSLRKKLKKYGKYIRAVPGVGYAASLDHPQAA